MKLNPKYTISAVALGCAAALAVPAVALASTSGSGGQPQPICTPVPVSGGGYDHCPTPYPTKTTKPPKPYPTPTTPTPPPTVTPVSTQQEFDLVETTDLANGWTQARGPANWDNGTISDLSPLLSQLIGGGGSVYIRHEELAITDIDRTTCTLVSSQFDEPFTLAGGTGLFSRITGTGFYDLQGMFSFPTRNNRCTLPSGLSLGQATWDVNYGSGLPTPLAYDVTVQAVGTSRIGGTTPYPTPTYTKTTWAPTTGPVGGRG